MKKMLLGIQGHREKGFYALLCASVEGEETDSGPTLLDISDAGGIISSLKLATNCLLGAGFKIWSMRDGEISCQEMYYCELVLN